MASIEHEILIQLFRDQPALACELLRRCADIAFDGRAELGPTDLSQVAPTHFHADNTTIVRAPDNTPAAAVIVEVQRSVDADKLFSWPVYVTTLRSSLRCPVVLLVLATEDNVARWARGLIATGHPGFELRPIVLGFDDVPRIADPELARRIPQLSVLSAIAHPDPEIAQVALETIADLPGDTMAVYFDVIAQLHGAEVEERAMRETLKYRSEFLKRVEERSREEGRRQGHEEGQIRMVIELARVKLGALSVEDETRIGRLRGDDIIAFANALTRARDEAEARAVLEKLGTPVGLA